MGRHTMRMHWPSFFRGFSDASIPLIILLAMVVIPWAAITMGRTAHNIADLRAAVDQNTAAISKLEAQVIALDAKPE